MENLKNFYNKKNSCHWCNRFKGSWLCSWLLKLGSKVYGTGNNPNKNKNLFYSLNLHKKIYLQLFDIRDYKKIYQLIKIKKPEIIFHLAAQPLVYRLLFTPSIYFRCKL